MTDDFHQTLVSRRLSDMGEASAAQNVHLLITLAHRDEPGLQKLIADQETPDSPSYLHFLKPQEFDAQFGATPQTRSHIKSVLASAGFHVAPDRLGASIVEADGPVVTANRYFATKLHAVREASGRVAMLPAIAPAIPTDLQTNVVSVLGLDTTETNMPRDMSQGAVAATPTATPQPIFVPCPCPSGPTPTPQPTPAPTPAPGNQFPGQSTNVPIAPPPGYVDDTSFSGGGFMGYAPYTYAKDFDYPVQHGFQGSAQFAVGVLSVGLINASDLNAFWLDMRVHRTGSYTNFGFNTGSTALEPILDVE
ncbi:MAG TPA: protease pro-enzyme activation domain-containing protein, partial [Candidatus Baltobacteraceae bacterium]|nr:protease pro-enzyme activation domain-containing protein [Candidatus Baltobacteraceae bacterium]